MLQLDNAIKLQESPSQAFVVFFFLWYEAIYAHKRTLYPRKTATVHENCEPWCHMSSTCLLHRCISLHALHVCKGGQAKDIQNFL